MAKKRTKKIQKKDDIWPMAAAGLAVLVAVVVLVVVLVNALSGGTTPGEQTVEDREVLIINGEPIYLSEIEDLKQQYSMQLDQQVEDHQIAEQLIFEKVIHQEAERRGITVSDEEVEREVEMILAQQGQTLEEYRTAIEAQGMTYEEFIERYKEVILFDKLAEQLETEPVTDAEVEQAFEMNREMLGEEATLEEYEDLIREELENQKSQNALIELAQQLIDQADIQVLDDRFELQQPNVEQMPIQ